MTHMLHSIAELSANYGLSKKEENVLKNACKILEGKLRSTENLEKIDTYNKAFGAASTYFTITHGGKEREVFSVAYLDNQHALIEIVDEFFGTIDGASVYPREIVKRALNFNAAAVLIMHNHPSGSCTPSEADRNITKELKSALSLVDVRLLDHLIIGRLDHYSFCKNGIL